MTGLSPIKTDKENIKQVRFIPKSFGYICEIIHNESINYQEIKGDKILGIDIGLRNIMSLSSGIIVNGKHLISYNQYYNKFKAMYMSFVKDKGTSNKIKKLERNRYFFFENQFHKISKWLINYCLSNGYSAIVIGKNNYWKQNVNLGKVNNQKFVSIPFNKLLQKVEYKANQVGIKVVYDDESYTSKCDALAFEKIGKKENYLGKRKKRGLFQSSIGKLINADINGALNILRKVVGDSLVKEIIDRGQVFCPVKLTI